MEIGNYILTSKMKEDLYGTTYKAITRSYDNKTGREIVHEYAVKIIDVEGTPKEKIDTYLRFLKNIVRVSSMIESNMYIHRYHEILSTVFENRSVILIVTDHIDGYTLEQYMENKTSIDFNTALNITTQISESLDFLHTYSIAHRNIKPSNIMYDENNKRWKLIDYIISCSKDYISLCPIQNPLDIYYTAPEALIFSQPSNDIEDYMKQDIWSLGVVFFGLLNNGNTIISFQDVNTSVKKELQLVASGTKPIQKSQYVYQPLNSIVDAMLNVDITLRPTSGQLIFLLYLARPGCKINDLIFTHKEVQSLLYSFGIEPKNYNDYTLCLGLTNELEYCDIKTNKYSREQLLEFSELIDIENAENLNITELCYVIKQALNNDLFEIKKIITTNIIQAIGYLTHLQAKDVRNKFESNGVERIQEKLQTMLDYGIENDLISVDLLNLYRIEVYKYYHHLIETTSISFAYVYKLQNNYIIRLMKTIEPSYEYNAVPIENYTIE